MTETIKNAEEVKASSPVLEKFQGLLEQIEKMSVIDLSEFVKILEDRFGVSAAMPMMALGAMPASGAVAAESVEEKTEFTVELSNAGPNKIAVIKVIREITQIGLKEAKDLVEGAPKTVKESVKKEEAETIKKKLEEAGAQVVLK